jgi:hypothetical protein
MDVIMKALILLITLATTSAHAGQICLSTARGEHSYVKGVCGKDIGGDNYACVFPDGTSETCFKDGKCFVCAGDD